MRASQAYPPIEFRFLHDEDIAKYGDRWWLYNESALIRMPVRSLIELESALGMPLVSAMNGIRMKTVLGDTAGAWMAIRAADPELAGSFDDFNPLIMLTEWRPWQNEGKEPGDTEEIPIETDTQPGQENGSHPSPPLQSTTSEKMDTVVLQNLPISE